MGAAQSPFTPGRPLPKITGPLTGGFLAVMGDGSINFIPANAKAEMIEGAIRGNDGR